MTSSDLQIAMLFWSCCAICAGMIVSVAIIVHALRTDYLPLLRAYLEARARDTGTRFVAPVKQDEEPLRFHAPDGQNVKSMFNTDDDGDEDEWENELL